LPVVVIRGGIMLHNTPQRWGLVAQGLHWVAAALVVYLLGQGFWMTGFAPRDERLAHYASHASVGYFLLALVFVRMLWRWMSRVPPHPAGAPPWERVAAMASHIALYLLLLAESYVGWALAGTYLQPLDRTLFGLVRFPPIVRPGNRELHATLEGGHTVLAWILLVLIAIHVAAAFYHWKIRRDDVMQRMLPTGRS
jgi:cytochrome b561